MNNYEKNLEKINKYFSEILLLSDVLSFNFDIVSSKSNDFYLPIPIIVYKDMIKCNIVSRRNSQLTKREKIIMNFFQKIYWIDLKLSI